MPNRPQMTKEWRESEMEIEYAGGEPYTFGSALIAIGIVAAIFGVCMVSMPEFRGFISILGN